MRAFMDLAFWLLVGHAMADYLWQSAAISKDKRRDPDRPGMWMYATAAHSLANAGAVAWATGSVPLGIAEFAAHFVIDTVRCEGYTSRAVDQQLHLGCKALWAWIVLLGY